jgi:hypothetical protein
MTMDRTQLEAAYRHTHYRVRTPDGGFVIRIGQPCAALETLLRETGASCWAFITACNPRSQSLSAEVNAKRMAQLTAMLTEEDLAVIPGEGADPDGGWPPEESVLVLDIEREEALELGRAWEQNAIVCGEAGGLPELLWCM